MKKIFLKVFLKDMTPDAVSRQKEYGVLDSPEFASLLCAESITMAKMHDL